MKREFKNREGLLLREHEHHASHSGKETKVWALDRECKECRSIIRQPFVYSHDVNCLDGKSDIITWDTRCPACGSRVKKLKPEEAKSRIMAIFNQAVTEAVQVTVDTRACV